MAVIPETPSAVIAGDCIHDRVRYWAQRRPNQVAISSHGSDLTYGELWARSTALAAELRRPAGQRAALVAVALPRSAEFVVAVLAVLRAGCCYVPIDPGYPESRQQLIFADSGARSVITTPDLVPRYAQAGVTTIALAPGGPMPVDGSMVLPSPAPGSLAYVIYTSGSTGRPKGVAVTHQNVMSLLTQDGRLSIEPGQVVAQLAPTAFDASVFEIWSALCGGARLVLLATDEISIEAIGRDLRRWRPDWLFLTTGLFHVLAEHDPGALSQAATVITGGDVLSPRLIKMAGAAVATAYAAYGPTEATVFSSLHRVVPDLAYQRIPLGTPLAGRTMFVLDERMRPVPDGTPGEIYLGGAGVARGYLGKARESAERFVPDPFADVPGQVLYRTGDLGVRRPDGEFEFLGRIDRQVKVRGFRVEPGEIEALLDASDAVESAVVVARRGPDGDRRLVAYVVPATAGEADLGELREMAERQLPGYMQPSYYLAMDELPLDPNGKVDRRALPDPWRSRDEATMGPFTPPRTGAEELIARILSESLGLDQVSRDDDFFAIGGNSLQSVRVLERLRAAGIQIKAAEFFARPTVAALAELIQEKTASGEAVRA